MKSLYGILRGALVLAFLLVLAGGTEVMGQSCFTVTTASVTCGTPEGGTGYTLDLGLLNNLDMVTALVEYTIVSPANVAVTPGSRTIDPPAPVPDTIRTPLAITGNGATAGTTVKILVRIANGSSRTAGSCSDTVTVVLPSCNTDCLSFINDTVLCNEGPRGTNYIYRFDLINEGNLPVPGTDLRFSVISPGTVSVSPTYRELSSALIEGDTLREVDFTLDGVGAVPGTVVTVRVSLCNGGRCCDDTLTIALPSCRPEGCIGIEEERITCGETDSHYVYSFTYKNLSNFLATGLTFSSDQVEFVTDRFDFEELDMDDITSQTTGVIVPPDLQGKVITFTATLTNDEGDTCRSTFEMETPECSWGCFSISDSSISCLPEVSGVKAFGFRFTFHNESDRSIRWINAGSLTPQVAAGTGWIDLGTEVGPGESIAVGPVPISGPAAVAGLNVIVRLTLAGSSPTEVFCDDTVSVVLPDCRPDFAGCAEFIEEEVICMTSPTAPAGIRWNFRVSNTSNRNLDSLLITAVQSSNNMNVTISPTVIRFPQPLPPGAGSPVSLTVTGPGVVHNEVLSIAAVAFFEEGNTCSISHELDVFCDVEEEPECFTLNEIEKRLTPGGENRVDWTFRLTNTSGETIDELLISSTTESVIVANSPYALTAPLLPDSSATVRATFLNGVPGEEIGVVIASTLGGATDIICTDTVEMTLPENTNSVAEAEVRNGIILYNPFPNPTTGESVIRFSVPSAKDNVAVTLVDPAGREIPCPTVQPLFERGEHLIRIDTKDLPSGHYRIVLRIGDDLLSRPLTVVR